MTLVRVGGLIHRFSPGNYTLEVILGGLTSDFSIPWASVEPISAMVEEVPVCPAGEILAWSVSGGYTCIPEAELPPEYWEER